MSIYTEKGFKSRMDYLESLAQEYGVELRKVIIASALLGPDEDFDGLIADLEDLCGS